MTSEEFDRLAVMDKTGKNIGVRSIWFIGRRTNRTTCELAEHCKPQWEKFLSRDFSRIKDRPSKG